MHNHCFYWFFTLSSSLTTTVEEEAFLDCYILFYLLSFPIIFLTGELQRAKCLKQRKGKKEKQKREGSTPLELSKIP